MTRIVAGKWGGRRLVVPRSGVRPTADRVREAVFNWLDHRLPGWDTTHVLDLYAGSGALGLESVSRGAARAVLVERDPTALAAIERNIDSLSAGDQVSIRPGRVLKVAAGGSPVVCDVVFADPPYDVPATQIAAVLDAFMSGGWTASDTLFVVETDARADSPWPTGVDPLERRPYGDTAVWYGRRHTPSSGSEKD